MPQRSSRNHKIEPLDYAEMAQAPALKGAVSFLDITPNDVQSGFARFGAFPIPTSPIVVTAPGGVSSSGDETYSPRNSAVIGKIKAVLTPIKEKTEPRSSSHADAPNQVAVVATAALSFPTLGDDATYSGSVASAGDGRDFVPVKTLNVVTSPGPVPFPGPVSTPGHDTARPSFNELTPGRGRSKVRRCVLAQDGHSLGEEAIYQVLWRTGRPESTDPNSSRTVRMGAADVGLKVNMAKKNVRQNISKLYEKLALEILEDFETMSSQPRLYRIFSYKQILERRRAAGLDFVLRNKGVVFCSRDGAACVTSPAYVKSPGDETLIRPAPPKKRRAPLPPDSNTSQASLPAATSVEQSEDADLLAVSQALNRYWPVDQPAAVQLIRACRKIRSDARADEISFFVREKLELARQNRSISNPTGLILSTVPQSFVGSTFLEFRKRMERQAVLAAEEAERKLREEEELKAWLRKEYEDAERVVNDESKTQKERDTAERTLRQLGPQNLE